MTTQTKNIRKILHSTTTVGATTLMLCGLLFSFATSAMALPTDAQFNSLKKRVSKTEAKIKTLQTSQQASRGPQGPQGPQGLQGPVGPPGNSTQVTALQNTVNNLGNSLATTDGRVTQLNNSLIATTEILNSAVDTATAAYNLNRTPGTHFGTLNKAASAEFPARRTCPGGANQPSSPYLFSVAPGVYAVRITGIVAGQQPVATFVPPSTINLSAGVVFSPELFLQSFSGSNGVGESKFSGVTGLTAYSAGSQYSLTNTISVGAGQQLGIRVGCNLVGGAALPDPIDSIDYFRISAP